MNQTTRGEFTPLVLALEEEYDEIAQSLLETGKCEVHYAVEHGDITPLAVAVKRGMEKLVRALVRHGWMTEAIGEFRFRDGKSPLDVATDQRKEGIVKILLRHGIFNIEYSVMAAAKRGAERIVQLLVDSKGIANMDKIRSAVSEARNYGHEGIFRILERFMAYPNPWRQPASQCERMRASIWTESNIS